MDQPENRQARAKRYQVPGMRVAVAELSNKNRGKLDKTLFLL